MWQAVAQEQLQRQEVSDPGCRYLDTGLKFLKPLYSLLWAQGPHALLAGPRSCSPPLNTSHCRLHQVPAHTLKFTGYTRSLWACRSIRADRAPGKSSRSLTAVVRASLTILFTKLGGFPSSGESLGTIPVPLDTLYLYVSGKPTLSLSVRKWQVTWVLALQLKRCTKKERYRALDFPEIPGAVGLPTS